jgi:hypothetical protein
LNIILRGDTSKAAKWLGFAKSKLRAMRGLMSLSGRKIDTQRFKLNGNDATVLISSCFGQDKIIIYAGGGTSVPVICFITTAKPFAYTEMWIDEEGSSDNFYEVYAYDLAASVKSGSLTKSSRKPSILYYDEARYADYPALVSLLGFHQTVQTGADMMYAQLSNYFIHEEEIGGLKLRNPSRGLLDENSIWGQTDVLSSIGVNVVWGSDKGLISPGGNLTSTSNTRLSYELVGGDVKYRYFWIVPETTFNPYVAGWDVFNMVGRLEVADSAGRLVKRHTLYAWQKTGVDTSGADVYEQVTGKVWDDINGWYAWKYYVPIMAVSHDKALVREVERIDDDLTCSPATLTESLSVGDIVIYSTSYATDTTMQDNLITGEAALPSVENSWGYSQKTCNGGEVLWTISGDTTGTTLAGGGVRSKGDPAILHTSAASCGELILSADCPSCHFEVAKTITFDCPCGGGAVAISSGDTIIRSGSLELYATLNGVEHTASWEVALGPNSTGTPGVFVGGGFLGHPYGTTLTAGADVCGSIVVAATICGSSDTQAIRVTDSGSWHSYLTNDCFNDSRLGYSYGAACAQPVPSPVISGIYRYGYTQVSWQLVWDLPALAPSCTGAPIQVAKGNAWYNGGSTCNSFDCGYGGAPVPATCTPPGGACCHNGNVLQDSYTHRWEC